jgi:abhydrolase domain-containing protein 5
MSTLYRFSADVLEESQKDLIEISGVELTSKRIPLEDGLHLYCLACGNRDKPVMVLLHGYCGAGGMFFKILKDLVSHFYVYIPDLLGMGRSSRPEWTAETLEETEAFFVEPLEHFRKYEGLESFVLTAHSFGGYVAGCYAEKYPERVNQLIFLSPAGIARQPKDFDFAESISDKPWSFKFMMKLLTFFWLKNVTPAEILRKAGPFSGKLMQLYGSKKLSTLDNRERELIEMYLEQVNLLPGSGEYGLIHVILPGGWARRPLCDRLPQLGIPMTFIYGDKDWMCSSGGEVCAERAKSLARVKFVKDSDHHLYWDNPIDTSKEIIDSYYEMLGKVDSSDTEIAA